MSAETVAVDREALHALLLREIAFSCQHHGSLGLTRDCLEWRSRQATRLTDELTRSGILRDVRNVKVETWDEGHGCGVVDAVNFRQCPTNPYRDLSPAPDLGTPYTPPDGAFTEPDVHDPRDLSPAPEAKP